MSSSCHTGLHLAGWNCIAAVIPCKVSICSQKSLGSDWRGAHARRRLRSFSTIKSPGVFARTVERLEVNTFATASRSAAKAWHSLAAAVDRLSAVLAQERAVLECARVCHAHRFPHLVLLCILGADVSDCAASWIRGQRRWTPWVSSIRHSQTYQQLRTACQAH